MVNARPYKKARLVFIFDSLRHFDFFNCETETLTCFKYELENFRF